MKLPFFALRRATTLGITMLLAFALVACASDDGGNGGNGGADGGTDESVAASPDAGGGSGTATVEGGEVTITADNLEFSATTIEAPAGETWTITFTNNDSAPHNIAIYTEEGGDEIVVGEVINGGETVEVEVPALDAGEYYFVCDVHPDMNGTVVVG